MGVKKVGILYKADVNANPLDILPEHEEMIRKVVPNAIVVRAREEAELLDFAPECEVLCTWGLYKPKDFFAAAKNLKWVHVLSAGFDGIINLPGVSAKRMTITATKGIHGLPIAEHTICMMLMFLRGFNLLRDRQLKREWKRFLEADELEGKTVGIVGVGEIGKVIAQKCKLLGMHVLGTGPRPVQNEYLDRFYLIQDLQSMLPQVDFLILVCPLTAKTRGMIGEKEMQAMKDSAFLFNLARGPVINNQALLKALKEGWIAGAGLDALDPEPLPPESELWGLPNVIISPHMSAISPYYMHRAVKVFAENLRRFDQGEPLLYQFDWDKGY
ncbi:MAG: D-2-hydroxyacid dehydrogenase [Candidatus Korobacteraceae bacterium]|jgi:phosphoglycerate dehydrogenase-like enzyme